MRFRILALLSLMAALVVGDVLVVTSPSTPGLGSLSAAAACPKRGEADAAGKPAAGKPANAPTPSARRTSTRRLRQGSARPPTATPPPSRHAGASSPRGRSSQAVVRAGSPQPLVRSWPTTPNI